MKKILFSIIATAISTVTFAQPSNDICNNAITLTPDGSCVNGTLTGGNDNIAGEAGCATNGNANEHIDVWYTFTATGTDLTIDFNDLSIEAGPAPNTGVFEILLFSGSCGGAMTLEACTTNGGAPLTLNFNGLTIGDTYYYVISHSRNNTGNFETCLTTTGTGGGGGGGAGTNQDCVTAIPLCNDGYFSGGSSGTGSVNDLSGGNSCFGSGERESSWFTFTILTGGTLTLTISPDNQGVGNGPPFGDDYDYALWGPNPTCPPSSPSVRCSYTTPGNSQWWTGSADTGFDDNSGVDATPQTTDSYEDLNGNGTSNQNGIDNFEDGWTGTITVNAGEVYTLLVDNFSNSAQPFTMTWGGTAVMDCAVLSVELLDFYAEKNNNKNTIFWNTSSETNNNYFTLERSRDGKYWEIVTKVDGAGTTNSLSKYKFVDDDYYSTTNYYRLKQTDFNGLVKTFNTISVNNEEANKTVVKRVNSMGKEVNEDYKGVVLIIYSDNSVERTFVK